MKNEERRTKKDPRAEDGVKHDVSYKTSDYFAWIGELKIRYRATQIKAAISVNSALIEFYLGLGKDISEKYANAAKIYGTAFFVGLSADLKVAIPECGGLSPRNIRYCRSFYELFAATGNLQQLVAKLVCVPWGHHVLIIDKCGCDAAKAQIVEGRVAEIKCT